MAIFAIIDLIPSDSSTPFSRAIASLFALFVSFIYIKNVLFWRLKAYPDGLSFQTLTQHIFIKWEELSHFEIGYVRRYGYTTRLVANKYIKPLRANRFSSLFVMSYTNTEIIISEFMNVPLIDKSRINESPFLQKDFGKLLYQYAPQLFGEKGKFL